MPGSVCRAADAAEGTNDNNGNLSSFYNFSEEQVSSIDHSILQSLERKVEDFRELQSQNLKLNVTIDEIKSLSTQRTDELKAQIGKLMKENDSIQAERSHIEEESVKLSRDKFNAQHDIATLEEKLSVLNQERDSLKVSRQEVTVLLEEKVTELGSCREEFQKTFQENKDLRRQMLELENTVQNLKSREIRDQSEIQTMKQQMAIMKKNTEWLEKEVTTKTEQLAACRHKTEDEIQRLTTDSMTVKNDLHMERSRNGVIAAKNDELSKTLQAKLLELKEMADSLQAQQQEFVHEMAMKQKLIDLLESQVKSLQNELTASLDKNDSELHAQGEMSADGEKQLQELLELRNKFEESEQERLRLESVIKELLPENKEVDRQDSNSAFASLRDKDGPLIKTYSDVGVLKKELIKERHQKERLQRQVESFIVELEYKIPVINSFKERTSMLEKELNDVALLLEHTSNEKEKRDREFEASSKKIKDYESTIQILTKQRTDLAHQVQFLLINLSIHADSRGPLSPDETAFVKRIISNDDPSSQTDSQRVVSERLVEFNNIASLQEKNMELLKTVRNLADRLEAEEKDVNKKIQNFENDTIKEAKEAIVTLQDYNSSLESRIDVLTKERDAFKALCSADDESTARQSDSGKRNSAQYTNEEAVRALEARLTSVTVESSQNSKMLNEEIQELYKSKTQISIELQKERSSKTLAEERLKLIQHSLELARSENSELTKRSQNLQNILERQDARTTGTINELIACNSKLAVLETKISNLEAERELLQSSNDASRETNLKLSEERNSLRIMVTQLQTLQSEREKFLQEIQKAYKENLDSLEREKAELKARMDSKIRESEEVETNKRVQNQWYQDKVDSLNTTVSGLKQEIHDKTLLVDGLQIEIKKLQKQQEESDARIQSYNLLNDSGNENTTQISLRKELEKKNIALSEACADIDHYKELLSVNQDSLDQLTQEFTKQKNHFVSRVEALADEKANLEHNMVDLNGQLSNLNGTLQDTMEMAEKEKTDLMKKISMLESSNKGTEQLKEEYDAKISQLKRDLEQQASFANRAQRNYEEELQKDSNISKQISELREQSQKDKLEIEKLKTLEEQAKRVLQQNEKSWLAQKEEYERQLDTSRQHLEDLSAQNGLLYDQVELFSKDSGGDIVSGENSEIREILVNLRRERDILSTKLAVSQREEQMLRKSLATTEDELDKTKRQLSQFQRELTAHSEVIVHHEQIMQQLDQLNLLRESNITLRNVSEEANKRNQGLQEELDRLLAKILPLETELDVLQKTQLEKNQQVEFYKAEMNRWKERSQEILRKHDRIDPEDHRLLNEKFKNLEAKLEETSKENKELDDRFSRLKKQAHEKLNNSKISQASLTAQINELKESKSELERKFEEEKKKVHELQEKVSIQTADDQVIDTVRGELAAALEKSKRLEQKVQENDALITKLREEIDLLKTQLNALKDKNATMKSGNIPENIANVVESMKKSFEEEKINFIKEKTEEFRRLEKQKDTTQANGRNMPSNVNYEEMKKQLESEYEEATLKRIAEAEDNLKKRIRLPTEEKIKKIVEKKKAALEEQYKKKLEESKVTVDSSTSDTSERESLKQQIERDIRAKFEEELKAVKKKAYEEGRQQAAMKSTLLERKITKLESQLQSGADSSEKDSNGIPSTKRVLPSKIDEKSITSNKNVSNPLVSGEKVLKLDSSKPAFTFQALSGSNPFTSSPQSSDASSASAFGFKPTFMLSENEKKDTNTSDDHAKGAKPINPFSSSTDEKTSHPEHDSSKTTTPITNQIVSTPLKRAVEDEENPEAASENKRPKDQIS
ncbi:MLP2 (YIL149C) and MLP1 (YKR095W) [Zygosaccharomyces parabailii]|nr:MLP2 (YIL149C) and MLP1 (YKR095W) [Zygosaccharomyces parabailii]